MKWLHFHIGRATSGSHPQSGDILIACSRRSHLRIPAFDMLMGSMVVLLLAACADGPLPLQPENSASLNLTSLGSGAPMALVSQWGSNRCMAVNNGSSASGTRLVIWSCNEGPTQQFVWRSNGEIRFGDMCVAADGTGKNGDSIVLRPCNGSNNQKWAGSARSEIVGINNQCIDFSRKGAGNGTPLQLWRCANADNQKWDARSSTAVVATVHVDPSTATVVVDGNVQLTATAKDANGAPIEGATFTWSSSSTSVATVNASGQVSGVAAGSATITAMSGTRQGYASITVTFKGVTPPPRSGIWIGAQEIAALPSSGTAWNQVLKDADRDPGTANIADQSSKHDSYTLAAALVCVRTGQHCAKARKGVLDAIGTEFNNQPGKNEPGAWLEVGRNLAGYVIAADLLNLRADGNPNSDGTRVENWIRGWLTKQLPDNVTGQPRTFAPFHSGSNAAAQEGFAHAAVAAYLGDRQALDRAWDAFRTFACVPNAPDREKIDLGQGVRAGWAHDNAKPCAINPKGAATRVANGLPGAGGTYRTDGAIINDMRRGGNFQWTPGYTQYAWTGLAGFVPAAVILQRAGYQAFEAADRAVLRTHEYLWFLRQQTGDANWFDGSRGSEVIQLVNHYYGTSYTVRSPVSVGHTIGYTGWTHPVGAN